MRLALAVTLLPTLIFIAVSALTYQRVEAQLTRTYDLRLNNEIANLTETYALAGVEGLIGVVEARLKMYPSAQDRMFYGVFENEYERLAGNLRPKTATDGFIEGEGRRLRVTPLAPALSIAVGTTTDDRADALQALLRDLGFAIVLCLLGSLLMGFLSARAFAARLAEVNSLIDQVAAGHVSARLPKDTSRDEIGGLSRRINTMLDRIQKLIQVRKSISDQVAHEIRTPLTRLDNIISKAVEQSADPQPLFDVKTEIVHCVSLLDGLLDVSSLEAQFGDKQNFERIDLWESVQKISDFYEALAEDKQIDFHQNTDGDCTVFADPSQIERLIVNLIDNAIKYTPEGGSVSVKALRQGERVTLSVCDTGPGIRQDQREAIFQPFFRPSGSSTQQGHGLGLSLVKAIAERHDGILSVKPGSRNDPNSPGACFILSLQPADETAVYRSKGD